MRTIVGRKLRMTRIFSEDGIATGVTAIEAGPCPVVQVKTKDKDGYEAIQVGFLEWHKKKPVNKCLAGHFKKNGAKPTRVLRELPIPAGSEVKVGTEIKVDIFKPGDHVDVTGITKGKGFQGGMKRHNWHGGKATHGSCHHRRVGSIGAGTTPAEVKKGHPMPGRMGFERMTTQSLEVVRVDAENNLLLLKGAVPGVPGGILMIQEAVKARKPKG